MALLPGQYQIRDLVMGENTEYLVVMDTNPFNRTVRADQTGPRAWDHGSWSGAEWQEEAVVPLRIFINASSGPSGIDSTAAWLQAHQQLMAAFAPIADVLTNIELRFEMGGSEFILFGRPRMVESNLRLIRSGRSVSNAAFVALDPLVYSGELHTTGVIPLPIYISGMSVPLLVPFLIETNRIGGGATLVNAGTALTGLRLRLDGPLSEPSVTLQRSDGLVQTLRFLLEIETGQWLDVDTAARTVLLNGLPQASQRGQTVVQNGWPLLPPGTSEIRFAASDGSGTLTVEYRDAWF
jgi:hypothetical protein